VPHAWDQFVNNPDPRVIEEEAEAQISNEQLAKQWVVSEDPNAHIQSIQKLFDQGVTEVYIHSGQVDQMRVINFYANEVLPQLSQRQEAQLA